MMTPPPQAAIAYATGHALTVKLHSKMLNAHAIRLMVTYDSMMLHTLTLAYPNPN